MELLDPTAGSSSSGPPRPRPVRALLLALRTGDAEGGAPRTLFAAAGLSVTRDRDAVGALSILSELEQTPGVSELPSTAEQAEMWRGAAHLLLGDDEKALVELRRAVSSMQAGGREDELPRALVFLSEAEWRAGNETGADAAAEQALQASSRQASTRAILRGLTVFPDVVSRCIDAEAPTAASISAWRSLGRALMQAPDRLPTLGAGAHLVEFGRASLVVEGRFLRPQITKSIEVLAYLVSRPRATATREQLLDAVWGGSAESSACAYLRQAIRKLRDVLPPEITIERRDGRMGIAGPAITSDSASLDATLDHAAASVGAERIEHLSEALRLSDRGEYLAGCNAPWVDERREELMRRTREARLDLGEVQFELRHLREAWDTVGAALSEDALSERAWRLRMRVAQALGNDDQVVASYVDCRAALAEIGLEPSRATTDLVRMLRA